MAIKIKLDKNIKLIVSDFDGVFTDGGIYIFDDFQTAKKLNFKDIMGISQALKNDFKLALISGEKSKAVDYLVNKFPAIDAHQGIRDKLSELKIIIEQYAVKREEVIYIGDDVNDIECLNYVDHPITVPNSNSKVKEVKNVQITDSNGGDGAFREVIDSLLQDRL